MRPVFCLALAMLLWTAVADSATWNVAEHGIPTQSPVNITSQLTALLDRVPDGTILYFPAGTYIFCDFTVTHRRNLAFVGDGVATMWQYCDAPTSYTFMMTIAHSHGITLHDLTIDKRHSARYGGIHVISSSDIIVTGNTFLDSNPRASACCDRWGLVVASSVGPSTGIFITDNLFLDLSLEVDESQAVLMDRNAVLRSHTCHASACDAEGR
jgi:hypothetical protein